MREGNASTDANVLSLLYNFDFEPFLFRLSLLKWIKLIEAFLRLGDLSRAVSCRLEYKFKVELDEVVLTLYSVVLFGLCGFVYQACVSELTF